MKNIIIPSHWLDADEKQIEKFINYGLNHNQKYRCYYNVNKNFDFEPNFDDFPIENILFPNEGCYIAKIIKFKSKYNNLFMSY